jgi:hypothetical protein
MEIDAVALSLIDMLRLIAESANGVIDAILTTEQGYNGARFSR